ncbi:hypothetical protein CYMTET_51615 [Cymbomonas tetramitiformis]|uniref:Uncharacterized protein n=1 Tax=Cymbomonas tetramitiformis TaxID=36881 RepID=A0AAE0BLY0_9CHLO|nr:hypothetical protein CYMTET_51615 [Cymbomonas tetramitiformis]
MPFSHIQAAGPGWEVNGNLNSNASSERADVPVRGFSSTLLTKFVIRETINLDGEGQFSVHPFVPQCLLTSSPEAVSFPRWRKRIRRPVVLSEGFPVLQDSNSSEEAEGIECDDDVCTKDTASRSDAVDNRGVGVKQHSDLHREVGSAEKQKRPTRCNHPAGCDKLSRGKYGLCIAHGGGSRCKVEGIRGSAHYCREHAASGLTDTYRKVKSEHRKKKPQRRDSSTEHIQGTSVHSPCDPSEPPAKAARKCVVETGWLDRARSAVEFDILGEAEAVSSRANLPGAKKAELEGDTSRHSEGSRAGEIGLGQNAIQGKDGGAAKVLQKGFVESREEIEREEGTLFLKVNATVRNLWSIPEKYPLWQVGDVIEIIGGTKREVTGDMLALLGEADNTLARIPWRLVDAVRILIANVVLNNTSLLSWEDRHEISTNSPRWTDSILMRWTRQSHKHFMLASQHPAIGDDLPFVCLYLYLVSGCAPIITTQCRTDKYPRRVQLLESLNSVLSSNCGERGIQVTLKDLFRHVQTQVSTKTTLTLMDRQYFEMEADMSWKCQDASLAVRLPHGISPFGIPVMLHKEMHMQQVKNIILSLRMHYASAASSAGQTRERIAMIIADNDTGDSDSAEDSDACTPSSENSRVLTDDACRVALYCVKVFNIPRYSHLYS